MVAEGKTRRAFTLTVELSNQLDEFAKTFKMNPSALVELILKCALQSTSAEDSFTEFFSAILSPQLPPKNGV